MAGHGLPISKAHVQGGQWPVIAALEHGLASEMLFKFVGCNATKQAFRPAQGAK